MAPRRNASRRALTILGLLSEAPGWRVHYAFFRSSSRLMLAGVKCHVNRSINLNDSGIWSGITVSVKGSTSAGHSQRLVSTAWPVLKKAISSAGFLVQSDLLVTCESAHFIRRVDSLAEVRPEWRFLEALRLGRVARGEPLPTRRARRIGRPRDKVGLADRHFAVLRKDRLLMPHLKMLRIVRSIRERVEGQLWDGNLALMGDAYRLQAVVQFWPKPRTTTFTPAQLDVLARVEGPLVAHGYDYSDDGGFGDLSLGRRSIRGELAFLSRLRLSDLLAPGISPAPWEGLRQKDRAFYDLLGAERADQRCKRPACRRGAVPQSVLCRVHHFETIKERPCPFDD